MSYFPDLSPYSYGHHQHPGVVHVGWLDAIHPYSKGPVETRLLEKIKLLASEPVELYRGFHVCELCPEPPGLLKTVLPNRIVIDPDCSWAKWIAQRISNGEIRVECDGTIFAAPVLIAHYIEAHDYAPPPQFLLAVEQVTASAP